MDALDLVAKIKMDLAEYEEGLDKAKSEAEKSGSGISGAFGKVASGVGTAMATAAKVTVAAVTTAATAVGALTTAAVKNFAEFEQLEGGTKLMFGEAADFIMKKSEEAYKTVQLSQNEYLEQVNGFATGLKESLGGNEQAAAELADKVIQAEADVVAATGRSQEEIQNAFNGIMKGNFMMLDNLRLGIKPTKEGFQEVIDKVNDYNASMGNATEYTIDNLADCEAALVQYIDMVGMSGYAQREASQTITGSLSMMKGAWSNLLTGIANDEADLEKLTENLVKTIVGYEETSENGVRQHVNGFLDNIIPVVETSLSSIGTLIEKLVPSALNLIPTLINNVLPKITEAATELAKGLVSSLSDNMSSIQGVISSLLDAFVALMPEIISLGGQIIGTLASAVIDNADKILSVAGQILEKLTQGIEQNTAKITAGAVALISKLVSFIAENADLLIQGAVAIVNGLMSGLLANMDSLIGAGISLAMALFEGLLQALPELLSHVGEFIQKLIGAILDHTDEIYDAATTLFLELVKALPDIMISLGNALESIFTGIADLMTGEGSTEIFESALMMFLEIVAALPQVAVAALGALWELLNALGQALLQAGENMLRLGREMFGKINEALLEVGGKVLTSISTTIQGWIDAIKGTVSKWKEAGMNLIAGLWSGFKEKLASVKDSIVSAAKGIADGVKGALKINSPSKVFAEIGSSMVEGLEYGWDEDIDGAKKNMEKDMKFSSSYASNIASSVAGTLPTVVGANGQPTEIVLYATTTLDGQKVGESTFNYTVGKINGQERAMAVATGGYY